MQRVALHLAFWMVCLLLSGLLTGVPDRQFLKGIIAEAWMLPIKIGLTYFTFVFLLPQYLDRQKAWKLVGWFLLAFVVATILYRLVLLGFIFPKYYPERPRDFFSGTGILMSTFDIFTTTAAASLFKLLRLHYANRDFEQQLHREKLQSELNFLRAQTNPHFLFNTLNNLYGLARRKSDQTADAILMLSKIMRFVLYECRSPRIPIEEEVKVIRDFIELEKLRYTDRLQVSFVAQLDQPDRAIAPLLLLPFVENAFKHGASGSTGSIQIEILLTLQDEKLLFEVKNSMENPQSVSEKNSGIGLKNVQRQLELIYPKNYQLDIQPTDNQFLANLRIDLTDDF